MANVICSDAFVTRFHADPRVQATELLLQERVPREAILSEPRPAESPRRRRRCRCSRRGGSGRRTRRARTRTSSRTAATRPRVTHAGGGFSTWRDLAVTRRRDDWTSTRAPTTSTCAIPWSGHVWSPTYQPVGQEPDDYDVTFDLEKVDVPPPRRRLRDPAPGHRLVRRRRRGPAAVDHQPRRSAARDRGHQLRRDRAGAGPRTIWRIRRSASCSSRREFDPQSAGLLFSRRRRGARTRRRSGRSTCSASRGGSAAPSNGRPIAHASSDAAARRPVRWRSTAGRCRARPAPCSTPSPPCASACAWRRALSSA